MAAGDGNGWIRCRLGHDHWGRHGAAGLLVRHDDDRGRRLVLMQQRIGWSHEGGTWAIPGGARDSHETPEQAAVREAVEEVGLDPALLELGASYVDDHGDWAYTTVLARVAVAPEVLDARPVRESAAVEWVEETEVTRRHLHSGFAATWPLVQTLV